MRRPPSSVHSDYGSAEDRQRWIGDWRPIQHRTDDHRAMTRAKQIRVLERTLLGNSLPLRTFRCAVNPREVFAVEIENSAEPKPMADA
jgi:hypothetical protein